MRVDFAKANKTQKQRIFSKVTSINHAHANVGFHTTIPRHYRKLDQNRPWNLSLAQNYRTSSTKLLLEPRIATMLLLKDLESWFCTKASFVEFPQPK